jgi:hypothetical protein
MMIMATTMADTKTTTPTNRWPLVLVLFGLAMAGFSYSNLTGTLALFADQNDRIVVDLKAADGLTGSDHIQALSQLRERQEKALAGEPAEPFAWARLAYLRQATQGDMPDAFAALRLSDLVSPGEPRQLPERAFMWRQFASVENAGQRAYQSLLWTKAFELQRDPTWAIAVQNNIVPEVGDAIKANDVDLYEEWKSRIADSKKKTP